MNRYILHRKSKGKEHIKYLIAGAACLIMAGAVGYTAHSIGTARAKSREIVPIYTEEELEYYLLDPESEEYNLKGRYRLEEDLDLGWLYQSIGTDVEPFAGTFDGNGHVISGLERPLFGVLKQAEVENLFLSEASIVNPVTYFDGERYVDGYGALAGYVIGSEIRNCGAGGSLVTDIPVETVYQTAKAKPEPELELEEIGPGMTESSGESLNGLETESGPSAGGPGVVETSAGEGGNQESLPGENGSSPENAGTSAESGEGMTGSQEETKETSAGETPDAETDLGEAGTGQENGGEGKPGGDIKPGDGTETPGETGKPGGTGNPGGAGNPGGTGNPGEAETPADTEAPAGPENPTVPPETPAGPEFSATQEPTAAPEPTASPEAPAGTEASPEPETIAMETRAYLRLMMKNAAITEVGLDNMATPSDAEAVESSAESLPVEAELPAPISSPSDAGMAEEETEFNPYEDTFINVTAEQVTAGGLIGQAEEGTALSNCFTCMTIESRLNLSDTYTGGFAGILGWDVSVENSYSSGYMECDGISAGFAAINNGTIQDSYSSMALAQSEDTFCHAFTAEGEGQYIDCFYDMQLADVETDTANMDGEVAIFENDMTGSMLEYDGAGTVESMTEHDEAGASESIMGQDGTGAKEVTGLSTRNITGMEAEVSGEWYLTGNAYPQISYFALNEHGIIADYSKVSAIPLLLPEGVTLSRALGDTADLLILPGEIEGQEILWEAGGDIAIDDSHQVLVSGKTVGLISAEAAEEEDTTQAEDITQAEDTAQAEDTEQISFSPREPVLVQSSLNDNQEFEEDVPQPATSNGNLKASIGSISKTFSLSGSEGEISAGGYADWNAVGKAVHDGTLPMPETDTDDAYLLSQPSHLAWFMYMVNEAGETGIHGKLTADINMDGTAETDVFNVLNTEWRPIGNTEEHAFTGEFDGDGHTISAIKIEREQTSGNAYGLFGYARDARIQNLYLSGTEILLAGTKPVLAGSLIGQSAGNTVVFRIGVKNSRIQISSAAGAVHGGGVVGNHETGALDFSACYARDTVIESEASGDNCETAAGLVTVNGTDAGAAESSVRSAYFTGTASILGGGASPQSGAGTVCLRGGTDTMVTNIYYNSIARSAPEGSQAGEELTREQLTGKEGTYLLNGENVTGVWAYSEGELPELSLYEARLTFSNWIEVGEALDNGTLSTGAKPSGDGSEAHPYQISTPEQLAWFSYRVWKFNGTDGAICGDLTNDIDLTGETYGGTTENPLGWIPIGRNCGINVVRQEYKGKFGENHERIYRISNMNIYGTNSVSRYAGLFGTCSGDASIRRIGIESGSLIGCVMGGIVGAIKDNVKVEECYNKVFVNYISDNYHDIGGIVGMASGNCVIKNCFSLGGVDGGSTRESYAGGIVGASSKSVPIINCYSGLGTLRCSNSLGAITSSADATVLNCYYETGLGGTDKAATGVTKTQLQSWAAAYALNGQNMDGLWVFTEGSYPGFGELDRPNDWSVVGQGLIDGLITSPSLPTGDGNASSPLQISSAEQLAVLAARVNAGETSLYADLLMDINLTGERYKGSIGNPIRWKPIGISSTNVYQGGFNGKGNAIGYMKVEENGYAGLFGCAGGGAVIRGLGLYPSCSVTATGTSGGEGTGGLVGMMVKCNDVSPQLNIYNCYNRGSVAGMTGKTGALVGSSTTTSGSAYRIAGCYAAGSITSKTGTPGAIAGMGGVSSTNIQYCFWNKNIAPGLAVTGDGLGEGFDCREKSTAEMNTTIAEENLGILHYLNYNGTDDGLTWKRSDLRNDGYPVLVSGDVAAVTWADVGGKAIAPRCKDLTSPGTAGQESNPYQIMSAEELAWFALQVNNGNPELCAELKADINLFGGLYSGFAYDTGDPDIINKALQWMPIGSDADGKRYTGTFNGNGYTVSAMLAKGTENQGLFGTLGDNAAIKKTSISDSRIKVTNMGGGGIAGYVNGTGVKITECGNKGSLSGTVGYFGGCVGVSSESAELILDGCYNIGNISVPGGTVVGGIVGFVLGENGGHGTIRNCMNMGKVEGDSMIGGIVGVANTGGITVTGCWNAETVTAAAGSSLAGSIIGVYSGSADDVRDCLIDENYNYGKSWNNPVVKKEAFGTWGAAWRLNGGSLKQTTGLSWTYDKTSPYPVLNTTGLPSAESWEQVGEAVEYGLIKDKGKPSSGDGNASPYQITAPEQLAWFAYQVNVPKEREIKGVLVNDIDMKAAEGSYISDGRLNWIPIGKDQLHMYQGTFESKDLSNPDDTHKIYRIQNLYASTEDAAGLFGYVWNGTITRIGLANAQISGTSAGGIVGSLLGTAEAAQCYNRSESPGSGSVTASDSAGGIAGQVSGGVVRDCYNQETVIKGTEASSSAGGIAGSVLGTIRNSYSACGTAGSITAGGSTSAAGAVAGYPDGVMSQCYSDTGWSGDGVSMADSTHVSRLYATGNTELQKQTAELNTVNGTQQMKENRIWYTSLESEATKGWPTLEPPVKMLSLGTVTPVDNSSGAAGEQLSLGSGVTISDAKVRDVRQETTGTQTVSLAEWKTEYYTGWGTTSANGKIGLSGVGGTSAILKPDQMSLENPVQGLGTISGLKVYIGAACTYPTDRDILVELSSGSDRYEIRFTIKGVTGKSLVVDLPRSVAMADELMPDGTEKTAYSVDTAIQNSQNYPMEGKILKAVPISKTDIATYQALKPIAKTTNYGSGQIYEAGVRLGITNPKTGTGVISGDLYYNPDATGDTNPWMTCQLKAAGGTLPYRYFLKYKADPYYDSGHPNFGYTISYQFGLMADDYSAAAGAVAWQ